MTRQQLKAVIIETIAQEAVQLVYSRLADLQKEALVICTGSGVGFSNWLSELQLLQQAGFRFDLLLSRSARQVLDVPKLSGAVAFGHIWEDEEQGLRDALQSKYATVIVPALTINTAAKLASCTPDTLASNLIFAAMMQQKNVIVSVNGCCPDNDERLEKGYYPTEMLRQRLRQNITTLKEYGAVVTTAEKLAKRTLRMIHSLESAIAQPQESQAAEVRKQMISRQDIAALPEGSTLKIPKGSMVTQLALDTALARRIRIVKEQGV